MLLANHGPVVSGDTLEAAVFAIEELEETAKLYLLLRGLNPRYLSPEQVEDLVKTFGLTLPEHGHEPTMRRQAVSYLHAKIINVLESNNSKVRVDVLERNDGLFEFRVYAERFEAFRRRDQRSKPTLSAHE